MIDEKGILLEESRRAEQARAVMDNPMVKRTIADMRSAIVEKWLATGAGETEAREWLWHHAQAVEKFTEAFRETLQTGQLADITLNRMEKE